MLLQIPPLIMSIWGYWCGLCRSSIFLYWAGLHLPLYQCSIECYPSGNCVQQTLQGFFTGTPQICRLKITMLLDKAWTSQTAVEELQKLQQRGVKWNLGMGVADRPHFEESVGVDSHYSREPPNHEVETIQYLTTNLSPRMLMTYTPFLLLHGRLIISLSRGWWADQSGQIVDSHTLACTLLAQMADRISDYIAWVSLGYRI